LIHNYGLAVSEIEYIIGRISGRFQPPSISPSQRPAFGSKYEKPSIIEKAGDEFILELSREAARHSARQVPQPIPPIILGHGSYYQQPIYPQTSAGLFGLQVYICNTCFTMKCKQIYFVPGEKGGILESPQVCMEYKPELLENSKMTADEFVNHSKRDLPQYLRLCMNYWSGEHTELEAIEIPSDPFKNEGTATFVDKSTTGKRSITLSYSEEKCVYLTPESKWALRAISERQTTLSDKELFEFFQMTKDATFGFFKMQKNNSVGTYMMAVSKTTNPTTSNKQLLTALSGSDLSNEHRPSRSPIRTTDNPSKQPAYDVPIPVHASLAQ
jgi:hypothetical protein